MERKERRRAAENDRHSYFSPRQKTIYETEIPVCLRKTRKLKYLCQLIYSIKAEKRFCFHE
uniref:Bm387, isoform b n=1 Tax=Brugia malayi TaxID=6279 RepID=A0A1I9G1E9_BRUMA|nr:Bm387, isoform b [Brugia malayi]